MKDRDLSIVWSTEADTHQRIKTNLNTLIKWQFQCKCEKPSCITPLLRKRSKSHWPVSIRVASKKQGWLSCQGAKLLRMQESQQRISFRRFSLGRNPNKESRSGALAWVAAEFSQDYSRHCPFGSLPASEPEILCRLQNLLRRLSTASAAEMLINTYTRMMALSWFLALCIYKHCNWPQLSLYRFSPRLRPFVL